jgi:phosphoenolpyruvate carboxylase
MNMEKQPTAGLQEFQNNVALKFQLYNSLFTSLPFHKIEKTGILLSLFLNVCEESYEKRLSPRTIVEEFFEKHTSYSDIKDRLDLLFRFVQYAERQVVLFDALEDAGFSSFNDLSGPGTIKNLLSQIDRSELIKLIQDEGIAIRLVLTAHPTQFYPGPVLGIINDLSRALATNNTSQVNMYLQQLGKTPFLKKKQPTPYDEAVSLIWYLENVFYHAAGRILNIIGSEIPAKPGHEPVIQLGFWPGGDRDGNPFVTTDITLRVADALRGAIIKSYYLDIRKLKKRLTFRGVDSIIGDLESKLYENIFIPGHKTRISAKELLEDLLKVRDIIINEHNGLFLHMVEDMIYKIEAFGLHFASLDIRQDSSVITAVMEEIAEKTNALPKNYPSLSIEEKIQCIENIKATVDTEGFSDIASDTIKSIQAIKTIQEYNGETGCHRYIISHSQNPLNILEVYALFKLSGWKEEEMKIDIIPLFETVEDLELADKVMEQLYTGSFYRQHLKRRNNRQTIMVGFSDGTKDGGYLMANRSIYKARERLSEISSKYGISVIFFDGRGGPPSRGGGKTSKFYASMGSNIANKQIQLTIQGQTVSSNFGTIDSARYNMEQLLTACVRSNFFEKKPSTFTGEEDELFGELAEISFNAYNELKNHPGFLDYLANVSPLKYYGMTNIASRPAKRGKSDKLTLEDLRAIPFVGSWSQLKQNLTGYYGVGTALKAMDNKGKMEELRNLYSINLFFKTLIDNCEMSMLKCFFPLTAYLADDPVYGNIWKMIYQEYRLTKEYLQKLTGKSMLMADFPIERASIQMREKIVLPITTIQQFAMNMIREMDEKGIQNPTREVYEKLVMRCSFGIINASRNSA